MYAAHLMHSTDHISADNNTDDNKIGAGGKKPPKKKKKKAVRRNIREKNLIYLTQLEKEMIDWALDGFKPFGSSSFQPTDSM